MGSPTNGTLIMGVGGHKDQLTAGLSALRAPELSQQLVTVWAAANRRVERREGAESLTAGNPSQVYLKRCGESVGMERQRGERAAAGEPKKVKGYTFSLSEL